MPTAPAVPDKPSARDTRGRRIAALTLVILATITLILASAGVWADRVALQDATWKSASQHMIADPRVRDPLAAYIATQIKTRIDLQTQLQQVLPGPTQRLAPLIATTLDQAITQATSRILARPAVQKLVVAAVSVAHHQAIDVLNGKRLKQNPDGTVTLSLVPVITAVAGQLGISPDRLKALPPNVGTIAVLPGTKLSTARKITQWARQVAIALVIVTLLLYAAAIWFAVDRRRQVWRVGFSLVVAALVLVLVRAVVGSYLPGAITDVPDGQTAVREAWRIVSESLVLGAVTTAIVGMIMILGAWLSGARPFAVRLRTAIGPWLAEARYAYGGLLVLVLILAAWGPTPATQNLVVMIIATACAAVGVEALRRQIRLETTVLPAIAESGNDTTPSGTVTGDGHDDAARSDDA